jgi:hypothetical protein
VRMGSDWSWSGVPSSPARTRRSTWRATAAKATLRRAGLGAGRASGAGGRHRGPATTDRAVGTAFVPVDARRSGVLADRAPAPGGVSASIGCVVGWLGADGVCEDETIVADGCRRGGARSRDAAVAELLATLDRLAGRCAPGSRRGRAAVGGGGPTAPRAAWPGAWERWCRATRRRDGVNRAARAVARLYGRRTHRRRSDAGPAIADAEGAISPTAYGTCRRRFRWGRDRRPAVRAGSLRGLPVGAQPAHAPRPSA